MDTIFAPIMRDLSKPAALSARRLSPEGDVYGVGEDGVMAFTDFGIESLVELIKMYKDDPSLLKRGDGEN